MSALQLQPHPLPLWLLLGADSADLLRQHGLPVPEPMHSVALADGFVTRTGRAEFLIASDQPPQPAGGLTWRYRRGDRVLALRGPGWRAVMAQVCHMDLSGFGPGDWLYLSAAGISVWCLGLEDGLLLGCDPSLGDYLQHTLTGIVSDPDNPLSPCPSEDRP